MTFQGSLTHPRHEVNQIYYSPCSKNEMPSSQLPHGLQFGL
jgi:hypothetical protein